MDILQVINKNEGLWAFFGLVFLVIGFITGFFKRVWLYIRRLSFRIFPKNYLPRETLKIVVQPNSSFWSFGSRQLGKGKKKIMHVVWDLYLTNITNGNILITATYMKKPRSEMSNPMVRASNSQYYGRYPILPRATTEGRFSYFLDEGVAKKGQDLIGNIAVIDQLGNEHIVKNVKFSSR